MNAGESLTILHLRSELLPTACKFTVVSKYDFVTPEVGYITLKVCGTTSLLFNVEIVESPAASEHNVGWYFVVHHPN